MANRFAKYAQAPAETVPAAPAPNRFGRYAEPDTADIDARFPDARTMQAGELAARVGSAVAPRKDGAQPAASGKRVPAPPVRGQSRPLTAEITGYLANANRGMGIGDEIAAGLGALVDVATGESKLDDANAALPGPFAGASMLRTAFDKRMAQQRGIEDDFAARRPLAAANAKGVGGATTMLVPAGAAGGAALEGGAGINALRGASTAGVQAAGYGLADRGTPQERVRAMMEESHNPVALALGGAFGAGTSLLNRAPRLSPEAQVDDAFRGLGLEPEQVPANVKGRARTLAVPKKDPRQAALKASADTLPVAIPLTKGELTGAPGQQLTENLALRGARGDGAALKMQGFKSRQQDAIRGNVDAIGEDMGYQGRGHGGAMVSDALNARYDASKAGVNRAFDEARGMDAFLPQDQGPVLGAHMREGLRDFDLQRVPSVGRELERIDHLSQAGPLGARELFDARARLSNLRGSSDAVEGAAAGHAVRTLDSYIDGAVTDDLFRGDAPAVQKWREAIGASRAHKQLFEGDDLIEKLTQRVDRGGGRTLAVDPHDATNYILGRSEMGFVGRQNLYRDLNRLKGTLGEASPEWNALRSEVWNRLAQSGEGGMEGGSRQFSGVKFAKAWGDFNARDKALVETLFSPEERQTIGQFALVSSKATAPVKGGDNPSNTAMAGLNLLRMLKFVKTVPGAGHVLNTVENVAAENAVHDAIRPTIGKAPPRKGPSAPPRLTRGIAVAASQGATDPGR